jgi:phosphoribosylformylglycinamidine (FGAM) synthase-like enzyme
VRQLIGAARVTGVHDISSGGLAVALAEMAMAAELAHALRSTGRCTRRALWRGSGPLRVTVSPDRLDAVLEDIVDAGIEVERIGTTGGNGFDSSRCSSPYPLQT